MVQVDVVPGQPSGFFDPLFQPLTMYEIPIEVKVNALLGQLDDIVRVQANRPARDNRVDFAISL
jgi:hypothetical protein